MLIIKQINDITIVMKRYTYRKRPVIDRPVRDKLVREGTVRDRPVRIDPATEAASGVNVNPIVLLSNNISRKRDARKDRKICGESLGEFVPSPYAVSHGATGSQSAPYPGLDEVLEDLSMTSDDSFIDIGCGKGRVLAYLVSRNCPCRIAGVEINPEVAAIARGWTSKFTDIEIIEGDAMKIDYNAYTVLFMYRPMETDAFKDFVGYLERTLTHGIRLYYYADMQSGYYLNGRPGWRLIRRKEIYRVHGLYIHREPQRYSVWRYDPVTAKGDGV